MNLRGVCSAKKYEDEKTPLPRGPWKKVGIKTLDINFPGVQYILLVVALRRDAAATPSVAAGSLRREGKRTPSSPSHLRL